jgi:hypothetical protein
MVLDAVNDNIDQSRSICGRLSSETSKFHPNSVIRHTKELNHFGVVIIKQPNDTPNDFIIMGRTGVDNVTNCKFSDQVVAQDVGQNPPRGKRAGSAGGAPSLTNHGRYDDSVSLTKATLKNRVHFWSPFRKTAAARTLYIPKIDYQGPKRIKTVASYRSPRCQHLSKSEVRKRLCNDLVYRKVMLHEQQSRANALLLVEQLSLLPTPSAQQEDEEVTGHQDFLVNFRKALDAAFAGFNDTSGTYHFNDCSLWEAILLEWACSTVETRNYEALAAHTDGNVGHPMETLAIHSMVVNTANPDYPGMVGEMTNGMLFLPYHHAAIEMECGQDVLHCRLQRTVHVPDASRGVANFTRSRDYDREREREYRRRRRRQGN